MPSTSRNNNQKRNRRYEVKDTSGWTHVVRGPKLPSAELAARNSDLQSQTKETSSDPSLPIDHGRLLKQYSAAKERWRVSSEAAAFRTLFEEQVFPRADIKITDAICVGSGSFTHWNISNTSRSLGQLVAFEHWIELLRSKYPISKVYIQDPVLTPDDIYFLRTHLPSVKAIYPPAAHAVLSDTTFLFAPYCPTHFTLSLLCVAQPALYIANDIHEPLEGAMDVDMRRLEFVLGTKRLRSFFESRVSWWATGNDTKNLEGDNEWLRKVVIYWERGDGQIGDRAVESFYTNLDQRGGLMVEDLDGGWDAKEEGENLEEMPSEGQSLETKVERVGKEHT